MSAVVVGCAVGVVCVASGSTGSCGRWVDGFAGAATASKRGASARGMTTRRATEIRDSGTVLAESASFLTTTDARRIEGGAKALAAAIRLSRTAVRMIYGPLLIYDALLAAFDPLLSKLCSMPSFSSAPITLAAQISAWRHRSREPSTAKVPLPRQGSH